MQNFIKTYPNFDRSKLFVVLNGIEKEIPNKLKKKNIIKPTYNLCCVGSVCHRKGQDIIIDALAKTNKNILKKIHVNIIGDGPMKKNIEELVSKNNLSNNVVYLVRLITQVGII